MIASAGALAKIPNEISAVDAGPLLCAGVTTFNALRNSGARYGDLVAILGVGGLGHLGVQFAAKMGFNTVAIARGKRKGIIRENTRCRCITSIAHRRKTPLRSWRNWAVPKLSCRQSRAEKRGMLLWQG